MKEVLPEPGIYLHAALQTWFGAVLNMREGGHTFGGGLLDLRPHMAAEMVKPCVCIGRRRCCRQALK